MLRAPVTERWEVHAEWFGSYTQGLVDDTQRPFFSPGTHYVSPPRHFFTVMPSLLVTARGLESHDRQFPDCLAYLADGGRCSISLGY